ncbi:MAG: ArsA family ATPase [Acidobacteria bacterium]|nr:ArsA family ATPase [Acidobacteriota bacterium]MBV9475181.1 ArsA family ATPase [Acidobacteriota bacterium]
MILSELDELASRRVVLFGGKGGVGKTTLSTAAALHYSDSRPTILFTTDPASNLGDFTSSPPPNLTIESLDARALYARFLGEHLESFLTIADRGTYLDRDELRRLMELALPGIDELMAWMRIGELVEQNAGALVVVDTAPTGHTERMLSASEHFRQLAAALDAMEEKHRALVYQFTRREVRDAMDAFIDDFDARARARRELLHDPARAAFVPVMLSEPLVVEQTLRTVRNADIHVPFVVLNRAVRDADCARDRELAERDAEARARFARVVDAPRACTPLDSFDAIRAWLRGESRGLATEATTPRATNARVDVARFTFLAGKGGVGKTSCASSIALQLARANPEKRYVVLSVDPAHSLRDVFAHNAPPPNLTVELIDTRAKWERFRATLGAEIERAVDALTPRGVSIEHDTEAVRRLIDIAPPGADELFAITRLADLFGDETLAGVVIDTAPTGHFLRLLDLPSTATEWVREFMRLLLRYKDLVPAGSLGEELVHASRAMRELEATLRSRDTAVIVVTRPERIVVAETRRLIDDVAQRGLRVSSVIANYVTPENDCACDCARRADELMALATLPDAVLIERRDAPPMTADELAALVPIVE